MNGLTASVAEFEAMIAGYGADLAANVELAICPARDAGRPPRRRRRPIPVGGQDCHAKVSGAHTGDIAAEQLKDAGTCCHRLFT